MKKILGIYSSPAKHWEGDGFPVRTLFSYDSFGRHISPFLMLLRRRLRIKRPGSTRSLRKCAHL